MVLRQGEKITDINKFLQSHNVIVDSDCHDKIKRPYVNRLEEYNNKVLVDKGIRA